MRSQVLRLDNAFHHPISCVFTLVVHPNFSRFARMFVFGLSASLSMVLGGKMDPADAVYGFLLAYSSDGHSVHTIAVTKDD